MSKRLAGKCVMKLGRMKMGKVLKMTKGSKQGRSVEENAECLQREKLTLALALTHMLLRISLLLIIIMATISSTVSERRSK